MRWIVWTVLTLIAAWGSYVASPYWSLYRLASAIEAGNVAEVGSRINLKALRTSLARQIAIDLADSAGAGAIAGSEAQITAGAALAMADPLLEQMVTPAGIAGLLRQSASGLPGTAPFGAAPVSLEDLDDYLGASTWRGFRNVYVSLPPDEPPMSRFRLQLRFGGFKWRLVAVELPPELRRRLADQIRRRVRP